MRCTYFVAEAQLGRTLRRAADRLRTDGSGPDVTVRGYTLDELTTMSPSRLDRIVAETDVLLGSMINSDGEAAALRRALQRSRPPVTLFFTSQPELVELSRIGAFDGIRDLHDRERLEALVRRLHRAGAPLPPVAHGLLAAAPRLSRRLGPDVLGPLYEYARAGLYWLHGSPENFARLLQYTAGRLPGTRRGAVESGGDEPPPPEIYPDVALWHPAAEGFFSTYADYAEWYGAYRARPGAGRSGGPREGTPPVGVVVFRQYVTGEATAHYEAVVKALEAEGVPVVAGFGGLDNDVLVEELLQPARPGLLLNLTGFNLVGSMGRPRPERAAALLEELDVPCLTPFPLLFQRKSQWLDDPVGLAPMQTALQVVLPELEGAGEPRVFAVQGEDDDFAPHREATTRLARRVRRWLDLRTKPPAAKRVAVTIFSFPPDRGSVGSAAYLDVFRSLHRLLERMKARGYKVDVPKDWRTLQHLVLGGDPARPGGPATYVEDTLPTADYAAWTPELARIEANFGPAPGLIDSDGQGLHIRGRAFGNVFIGVQPGFGYEGDPMRLLFSPEASPSHSFAAYYAWLHRVWKADALLHFGTHGALEFMPGKQIGLTPRCWPDALTGDAPHIYFYAMNNPSEATIAKRRSYATAVTYLSPPLREAGLYKTLLSLREALDEAAHPGRDDGAPIEDEAYEVLRALAAQARLDGEVPPPSDGPAAREDYVRRLRAYVHTLSERLIPVGLHVAGRTVSDEEAAEFLWAALQHPRPEENVPGLPHWLAAARGFNWEAAPPGDPRREDVLAEGRHLARELASGRRPALPDGPGADRDGAERLVAFAEDFLSRLRRDGELDGLLRALDGGYIPPAPGGDPARTPAALPTGRNLHALDPQRIPSPGARRRARAVVDDLLRRIKAETGRWPATVGFVLWGTDNIKTEGEGVAQVLELIGVEPVADSLGRMTRLRLLPTEKLGRPRIDVVLSASGIFRDIFPSVMELLDRAIQMAAAARETEDENYVRRHARAIAARLNIPLNQAARRVFSNAPGSYGTGVNHVVEASTWEEEEELGDVFARRKSYAFGADGPVHSPELLEACLATCDATFQNLDSTEIGLADVDHYYEYLGGLTAATKAVRGQRPPAYLTDTVAPGGPVRSLEEALRLETRTRLLNPRWFEAMLEHGYQGVHEIATRLDNTFGWSATADAVDRWIYDAAADTFVLDDTMRRRLEEHNPRALQRLAGRLLEASERGFWSPDETRLTKLRHVVMETEDLLEGVV